MNIKTLIEENYDQLSKSQKKVANFISQNPQYIIMHSASEVGKSVEVSETTVIRCCYELSFSGYAELQHSLKKQFIENQSSMGKYFQTREALLNEPSIIKKSMDIEVNRLTTMYEQLDEAEFIAASIKMHEASSIYVLGLRSSFAAAQWLSFALGVLRSDIHLIAPQSSDVLHVISTMPKNSVMIVLSFHRYLKETLYITEAAKTKGVHIIAITDSTLAPIRKLAHQLFVVGSSELSTIDSAPALMSMLNTLVGTMTLQEPSKYKAYKQQYDLINSDYLFVEGDEVF